MIGVDVSKSSVPSVSQKVSRGVRKQLRDAADHGFAVSQDQAPIDRGTLLQSGVPPEWEGDSIVWGYTADHARGVEEGQDPHHVPIEPLKGWARRVLGDEGAAYEVQDKIAEEGTRAQPFVDPGADAQRRYIRQRRIGDYIGDEL